MGTPIPINEFCEYINNNDMMGKLLMNILMSFNEFEVENIRERIKDVKRNNKKNGLVYGKLMFGKNKDGKKLINNDDEMKVIKYMKTLRSKGWSYIGCCCDCWSRGRS